MRIESKQLSRRLFLLPPCASVDKIHTGVILIILTILITHYIEDFVEQDPMGQHN